ncbi:MAG: hypothetical protein KF788_18615 [Piscinibacter sp.]|nr:hypothetical protein [Piscinibacter sp.]
MPRVIDLDTLPEADFLRRFGPPEFVAVDPGRPAVLAVIDDREGRPWACVDLAALRPDFLFYPGAAARVRVVDGDTVEIAIRAEFADHPRARWRVEPGDFPVLRRHEWEAAHPGRLPEPLRQMPYLAVQLPLRPRLVRLVPR